MPSITIKAMRGTDCVRECVVDKCHLIVPRLLAALQD